MANRDFSNLPRNRSIDLSGLDNPQTPPPPRRERNWGLIWGGISVFLIVCIIVGAGGYYLFGRQKQANSASTQPSSQNSAPAQPVQPGISPSSAPANPFVPNGPKKDVRICFVTFPSYDLASVIPTLHNPAYNAVLVPLLFQAEENGSILTKGDESDQAGMLENGECDVLFTTSDALAKHPMMGKGNTIVDRSHGADQIIMSKVGRTAGCAGRQLTKFNDLGAKDANGNVVRGKCTLALTGDSVSEFYGLSYLKITGLTVNDMNIAKDFGSPDEAKAAFDRGEADAWICWEPVCATDNNSFVLTTTKDIHTIYDGIIVSYPADQNKKPEVTEFLADWFTVVNMFLANPEQTSELIAQWKYAAPDGKTYSTNWWTGVNPGSAYADLQSMGLGDIAMAKFDHNLAYLQSPDLWWSNLELERKVWEWGGSQLETPFDPKTMIDTSYLQALSTRTDLFAPKGKSFLDKTFSPFPPEASQLPETSRVIAEYVCPNVGFAPDAMSIPEGSPQDLAFNDCMTTLVQVMNEADVRIEIKSSAAHPSGKQYGRCGDGTEFDICLNTAKGRASWAWNQMVNQGSFDMSRVTVVSEVGPRTADPNAMTASRFITIIIMGVGS